MPNPQAQNGKCPEGFTHVFGPLCVENTTLDKVRDTLPDIPEIPDFTSPDCEMALGALQQLHKTVEEVIQLPRHLMAMAKKLIDYPFDLARGLMDDALGMFDEVSKAIDDLLSGAGGIRDLKRALNKALECPFIANSETGQLIEEILDMLDAGNQVDALIGQLKNALASKANATLDALEETPAEALGNASRLFNDTLDRLGVKDMLDELEALERCVEAACAMFDVAKRIPTSADQIWKSLNGAVDAAGNRVGAAVARPVTAAQNTAMKVAEDFKLARAKVAITK